MATTSVGPSGPENPQPDRTNPVPGPARPAKNGKGKRHGDSRLFVFKTSVIHFLTPRYEGRPPVLRWASRALIMTLAAVTPQMHAAALSRAPLPAHNMPRSFCQAIQSDRAPTRTCRDWEVQMKTTEKENPKRTVEKGMQMATQPAWHWRNA